jgi:hypothetical protein
MAVRKGAWKVHFITQPGYGGKAVTHETPLVFNLNVDPSGLRLSFVVGCCQVDLLADHRRRGVPMSWDLGFPDDVFRRRKNGRHIITDRHAVAVRAAPSDPVIGSSGKRSRDFDVCR